MTVVTVTSSSCCPPTQQPPDMSINQSIKSPESTQQAIFNWHRVAPRVVEAKPAPGAQQSFVCARPSTHTPNAKKLYVHTLLLHALYNHNNNKIFKSTLHTHLYHQHNQYVRMICMVAFVFVLKRSAPPMRRKPPKIIMRCFCVCFGDVEEIKRLCSRLP